MLSYLIIISLPLIIAKFRFLSKLDNVGKLPRLNLISYGLPARTLIAQQESALLASEFTVRLNQTLISVRFWKIRVRCLDGR